MSDIENTGKEEQKKESRYCKLPGWKGQLCWWEEQDSYLERKRGNPCIVGAQVPQRGCYSPARSHLHQAAHTERQWCVCVCVCVCVCGHREEEAESHEKEWEEGKGRVTSPVTLRPVRSGYNIRLRRYPDLFFKDIQDLNVVILWSIGSIRYVNHEFQQH